LLTISAGVTPGVIPFLIIFAGVIASLIIFAGGIDRSSLVIIAGVIGRSSPVIIAGVIARASQVIIAGVISRAILVFIAGAIIITRLVIGGYVGALNRTRSVTIVRINIDTIIVLVVMVEEVVTMSSRHDYPETKLCAATDSKPRQMQT
jgi:hypothetical protein